ncbi:MAG TPA: CHASE2 domain-containing protein [Kofleriaceae bacterium]
MSFDSTTQNKANSSFSLGLGLRLGVVMAVLAVTTVLGLVDAGDSALRHRYYDLRGQRASHNGAILVAFDNETLAAWGAPPYGGERFGKLEAAIAKGRPATIGLLDPAGRLLQSSVSTNDVILPPLSKTNRQALMLGADGLVDSVALNTPEPTVVASILAHSRVAVSGDELPINYVGATGLPILPASRVASGSIPSSVFAGKTVLIGITAQPDAGMVPTPVGAMAPAQVQAHAILSATDGASWFVMPGWLRWLALAALALGTALLVRRFAAVGTIIVTTAMVALVLVFDYAFFASGTMLFGATAPLVAIAGAVVTARSLEREAVKRHLADLGLWTRQRMELGALRTEAMADEHVFWNRVSELARLYLDCRSIIVAELPANSSKLQFRVVTGVSPTHIAETRRDIRQAPYHAAQLTQKPVWHDSFMASQLGLRTLMIPLVVQNKLIGFWMVNFPTEASLEAPHMELIRVLAREVALVTVRRREGAQLKRSTPALGTGLVADLEQIQRSVSWQNQNQQDLLQLGESVPFGVAVATLWGEIRYMNPALKAICKTEGVDPKSADSLTDLLFSLTAMPKDRIQLRLRKFVQELDELRLRGRLHPPHGLAKHDLCLSWLASRQASSTDTEQLVVLSVMPHASTMVETGVAKDRRPAAAQTAIGARLAARATAIHTPKQKQAQFDGAVTMIRPRVDLTDEAEDLVLAAGTPRFNEEEAVVERVHDEHGAGSTRPFAVVRLPLPPAPSVNGVTIPFDRLMADFDNDLTRPVDKDDPAFGPEVTVIDPLLANLKVKEN